MAKGGAMPGAGRPAGRGPHGEATKPIRIPISKINKVMAILGDESLTIPLYSSKVQAGFPSPADDYIEDKLDLNEHLVQHPAATFIVKAIGDSMTGDGINENDLLIVDRKIEATDGKIVIAAVDGYLTVKRLYKRNGVIKLYPSNPNYEPIHIEGEVHLQIWGVVTHVIHSYK
jgi:DNA polymerase V